MNILNNFATIDIVITIFIFLFAIRGLFKGFIQSIMKVLTVVLSIGISYLFFRKFAVVLNDIGITRMSELIAFLLIFIAVILVLMIVENKLHDLVDLTGLANFDRALGFFLGIIEGLFIVTVIIGILSYQSYFDVSNLFADSIYVEFITKLLFSNSHYRKLINV